MAFCTLSSQFYSKGFCAVDNSFITDYMSDADELQIKVYLMGMYISTQPDTAITDAAAMAEYLGVKESQIVSAFEYWRCVGLVTVNSTSPLKVTYNHLPSLGGKIHKFKQGRFTDFNAQMQAFFPHRMITPNEYERYYEFLDSSKIKDETLITIAGYCVANKGDGIRSNYILAVARDWLSLGIRTPEEAEEKIKQAEACTQILREVAKALGKKNLPDFEDRQLYLKWTGSWGFSDEVILHAAASCKNKGGMNRLDDILDSYFRMSLFSVEEIDAYTESRRKLINTAKDIVRILGGRYDSYDYFIEKYVTPWLGKGFDKDALILIAEQCFIKGTKSPEGMNALVNKYLKEGCLTSSAIKEHLAALADRDKALSSIIKATGSSRNVTNNDRDLYTVWSVDWGFDDEVIEYAASLSAGKAQAMSYVGNMLSKWKSAGITALEDAKKAGCVFANTGKQSDRSYERHYTKQELDAFLGDTENFDNIEL